MARHPTLDAETGRGVTAGVALPAAPFPGACRFAASRRICAPRKGRELNAPPSSLSIRFYSYQAYVVLMSRSFAVDRISGAGRLRPPPLYQDHKKTKFGPSSAVEKVVRYSSQAKPISYLKANAAEVLAQLAEQREPLVITQNGEAKAVLPDVVSYEETQQTLALLKILALGQQDIEAGRVKPVADVVTRLRAKYASAESQA